MENRSYHGQWFIQLSCLLFFPSFTLSLSLAPSDHLFCHFLCLLFLFFIVTFTFFYLLKALNWNNYWTHAQWTRTEQFSNKAKFTFTSLNCMAERSVLCFQQLLASLSALLKLYTYISFGVLFSTISTQPHPLSPQIADIWQKLYGMDCIDPSYVTLDFHPVLFVSHQPCAERVQFIYS